MLAPPIPPQAVAFGTRLAQLRQEQSALENAIIDKRAEMGGPCVRSATNICGRTFAAAPNPWVAADGSRCAGYSTGEALVGSFCAHWGSPVRCCYSRGTFRQSSGGWTTSGRLPDGFRTLPV